MNILHALRRAITAGIAEYRRARWQQKRRKQLLRNNEGEF